MKTPYRKVTIADGVVLYLGDCRSTFDEVGPVDHVIMDPPYEDVMHKAKAKANGRGRSLRTDGGTVLRALSFDGVDELRPEVTGPLVDRCSGWFIAFCSPEGIAPWRDAIELAGARYKRACFYCKSDAAPQLNGQGPAFAVEPFVTAWCGRGVSRWNGGGSRNYFIHRTNGSERDGRHETEKPVSLMAEIVAKFTNRGELVFDPFMGSGTTGVACVRLGRRFAGVEKNPAHFEVAVERIGAALTQADLFVEVPRPVRQEKML